MHWQCQFGTLPNVADTYLQPCASPYPGLNTVTHRILDKADFCAPFQNLSKEPAHTWQLGRTNHLYTLQTSCRLCGVRGKSKALESVMQGFQAPCSDIWKESSTIKHLQTPHYTVVSNKLSCYSFAHVFQCRRVDKNLDKNLPHFRG